MVTPESTRAFLTAEWRHLAMINYACDPEILRSRLPAGTELDLWQDTCYVSVVGFLFLNTRVKGFGIPFHRNFEEVNLRFYVRRKAAGEWRRGVVFVRELVPRAAIAWVARTCYQEPYLAVPMSHRITGKPGPPTAVEYSWRFRGRNHSMRLELEPECRNPEPGSEAGFITEHYWGYNARSNGDTLEYQVEHPPWMIQLATASQLDADVTALYGAPFRDALSHPPASAFLAQGSTIAVHPGTVLTP